jgi:hypothetical protein
MTREGAVKDDREGGSAKNNRGVCPATIDSAA